MHHCTVHQTNSRHRESTDMAATSIRSDVFSDIIYQLLEVDYRIGNQSGQRIPLTTQLTTFVHKQPHSVLSRLILQQVLREYFGFSPMPVGMEDLEIFVAGSAAELGHHSFPSSDIDIMLYYRNLVSVPRRVDHSRSAASKNIEVLEMVHDTNFPGFIRLVREDGTVFRHADLAERIVSHVPVLSKLERHGPAWLMPNLLAGGRTYDFVPAVLCTSWPQEADSWRSRYRISGWPSKELIEEVVQLNCHVVPIGHRHSADQDYQWRISFSTAEVRLVHSLNMAQKMVYHILKGIFSTFPALNGSRPLTSYHLKTLILWNCEQIPPSLWCRHNIVNSCHRLLQTTKTWLLSNRWPNYFIPENNMLARLNLDSCHGEGCQSVRLVRDGIIAAIDKMSEQNGCYRSVLQSGDICANWYKRRWFPPSSGEDQLVSFWSKLDFFKLDIANYSEFRLKVYLVDMTSALYSLVFLATSLNAISDATHWLQLIKPRLLFQLQDRYMVSNSQILHASLALYYYTSFIKTPAESELSKCRYHELAKHHFFEALNSLEPRRNVFWPTLMSTWCYIELVHNPFAVHSDLIKLCDKVIATFSSTEATTVYERVRGTQIAPRLPFVRNMLYILDKATTSIAGFLILCEWVTCRLLWLPLGRLCFDVEEFTPINLSYLVKANCLLETYTGKSWDRFKIQEFMIEWKEVNEIYGTCVEQVVFKVIQMKISNLDRWHINKTRVY